jgi:DNA-binding GntR family transcriptional regulator
MTSLYQQVSQQILAQIESGALQVGDKLPPEKQYAEELGISRSTLRLAFSELERVGVLKRRKRAGTQIVSTQPKPKFNMSTTGIYELLSLGRDTELTVSGTRTVRTQDIPVLDGHDSETGHWLEVSGTRSRADERWPFNVNHVYVPARYAGIEPLLATRETSVFNAIERGFGVSVGRVSQETKAISCAPQDAKIMGLTSGAPVLQIVAQLYERSGGLMEVSIATFDPDRFQVRTDVKIE